MAAPVQGVYYIEKKSVKELNQLLESVFGELIKREKKKTYLQSFEGLESGKLGFGVVYATEIIGRKTTITGTIPYIEPVFREEFEKEPAPRIAHHTHPLERRTKVIVALSRDLWEEEDAIRERVIQEGGGITFHEALKPLGLERDHIINVARYNEYFKGRA